MAVDLIGKRAIIEIIKQQGFSKFVIYRQGDHGRNTPVASFGEVGKVSANTQAVNAFENWADQILTYNPRNTNEYDIILFSDSLDEDFEVSEDKKPKKRNANKIKFCFCLVDSLAAPIMHGQPDRIIEKSNSNYLTKDDIPMIITSMTKQIEENKILSELQKLHSRIDELESEEEEEEEEEEEKEHEWIGAVQKLTDTFLSAKEKLFPSALKTETETVISGTPEEMKKNNPQEYAKKQQEVKDNFELAISTLLKYDKNLDTDLLKLAQIAEEQPELFNTLIYQLREVTVK